MASMKTTTIIIAALFVVTSVSAAVKRSSPNIFSSGDDLALQFEMQRAERDLNVDTWAEIKKLREKLRPIYQKKYAALQKKALFSLPPNLDDTAKLQAWILVRHRLSAFYLALYAPIGSPGAQTILEILRNEAREEALGGIK